MIFGAGPIASVLLLSFPGSSSLLLSFINALLDFVFEELRIVLRFDKDVSSGPDFFDPKFGNEGSVGGDYAFIVDFALFEGGGKKGVDENEVDASFLGVDVRLAGRLINLMFASFDVEAYIDPPLLI